MATSIGFWRLVRKGIDTRNFVWQDERMNKSTGRAFTSGHQSAHRKVTHAPASPTNRVDALCGLTNTTQSVRNATHSMSWGRSLDIWRGDKAERMVNCQKCRKEMGL